MDFDSHFIDCCRACKPLSQNHQPPIETQGQGDCPGNTEITDGNIWIKADVGKKLRARVREKDKSGSKVERQKKSEITHCDCFKKVNQSQDFSDKLLQSGKQEKKNNNFFENSNDNWDFSHMKWDDNNMEKCYVLEEFKQNDLSDNRVLADIVSKLKEKVDFLYKVFNCEEILYSNNNDTQTESKACRTIIKGTEDVCELNRRLCIAEESIGKLALILEDLVKESNKKSCIDENLVYNDPLNFEELPIAQRINLLKSRNDMLISFMKDFLKVGSVEEIYSRLAVLPDDLEHKQVPVSPNTHHYDKKKQSDCSREKVMETLKSLRVQLAKPPEKKPEANNEAKTVKNTKKEENPTKFCGKKLEVISEHAELSLYSDNDSENSDVYKLQNTRNVKEKFSDVSEDLEETDLSLRDVTTKLFAQEAMLKSSLDKVHLELFSKQEPPEKSYTKANWTLINSPTKSECPTKERDDASHKESNFDSTREINCIYCETEIAEKSKFNDALFYARHDDYKEPVKEERKYYDNSSSKQNSSGKKSDEHEESKHKSSRRLGHKNSFTQLGTPKSNRANFCLSEGCSSSREETKSEMKARDLRPVTVPGFQNKTLLPCSPKTQALEKSSKKNLGIKNVKNKNKILLSKKSFVQTS